MDAVVRNDTAFTVTLSPTSVVATRDNTITVPPNGVARVTGGTQVEGGVYSVVVVQHPYKVFTSYVKVQATLTLWKPGGEPRDDEAYVAPLHHDDSRVEATGVWFLSRRVDAAPAEVDARQQRSGNITLTSSFNDATRTLTSVIQYTPISTDAWVLGVALAALAMTVLLAVLAFIYRRRVMRARQAVLPDAPPAFPVPTRHVDHAVQLP